MARFRRREVEVGVDVVDPDESLAAHAPLVGEALREGDVLERLHLVGLVLEAELHRRLEDALRFRVVAGVVLHQAVLQRLLGLVEGEERLAPLRFALGNELRAHAAVQGTPDRMAVLGGREGELRIDLEGAAEFAAALLLAARDAVREGEVLARPRLVAFRQHAVLEREVEGLHGVVVLACLVLPDPQDELLGGARAQHVLGDLRGGRRGLVGGRRQRARGSQQRQGERGARAHHWNLWRTVTSSRAFRSRFSACTGKVVLRTSILYLPGSSLSDFMGGVTPRDLPFTKISPQGDTANTSVAGTAALNSVPAAAAFAASPFAASALASGLGASPGGFAAAVFVGSPAFAGSAAGAGAGTTAGEGAGASTFASGLDGSGGLGAGLVAGFASEGADAVVMPGLRGCLVATRMPRTITSAASPPAIIVSFFLSCTNEGTVSVTVELPSGGIDAVRRGIDCVEDARSFMPSFAFCNAPSWWPTT